MFKYIREGDTVYYYPKDLQCKVSAVTCDISLRPIDICVYVNGESKHFDINGVERFCDKNPTLFWYKPNIEKQKTTKKLEDFIRRAIEDENIDETADNYYSVHHSKKDGWFCVKEKEREGFLVGSCALEDLINYMNEENVTLDKFKEVLHEKNI